MEITYKKVKWFYHLKDLIIRYYNAADTAKISQNSSKSRQLPDRRQPICAPVSPSPILKRNPRTRNTVSQ